MKLFHHNPFGAILLSLCFIAITADSKNFRIMSFNIRLVTPDDGKNIWYNRSNEVCKFIQKQAPDVFGLQEATQIQMDDISRQLTDYGFVGWGRDDGKQKGEYSPVFFDKTKYRLVKSGVFWLSETPDEVSFGWDAVCRRTCSWVVLQDLKTGNSFVFADTHLDHKGKEARTRGAMLIKERLSRIAGNIPMMITGDFNVTDQSEAYTTMLTRFFPLADAYKAAQKREGLKASFHNWGKIPEKEGDIIDFIFLSPSIKVKKATIYDSSLGDGYFLSDHHPIIADLDAKSL